MIGYGVGVAATMARTRVPELIAEALRPPATEPNEPTEPTEPSEPVATTDRDPAALESAS
jgi:hypothetical protein